MCLWGSPISTHGNYVCCSNTETKLARQGVIVGCWQGSALLCGWGLSGGRARDSQSLLVLPQREGCHLGWLLCRGGEKGKTKALKAFVLMSTCVTPNCPLLQGTLWKNRQNAALSAFGMWSSSLLFMLFLHFYLSRWYCSTQLESVGLSLTEYGLWPLRGRAAVWEMAQNHQCWQIC